MAGQFEQPFGLEALTSSKYIKLIERSLAGNGPQTAVGTIIFRYNAGVLSEEERLRWSLETAWGNGPFGVRAE